MRSKAWKSKALLNYSFCMTKFSPREVATDIKKRRREIGLTQAALARLTETTPLFAYNLENGRIDDSALITEYLDALGIRHGLSDRPTETQPAESALERACRFVNGDTVTAIHPADLKTALITGTAIPNHIEGLKSLLDDWPLALIADVIDSLEKSDQIKPAAVWATADELAGKLECKQSIWHEIKKCKRVLEGRTKSAIIERYAYQFENSPDYVISLGAGWYETFVKLCGDIDTVLDGDDLGFEWFQAKEKFGTPRFQIRYRTEEDESLDEPIELSPEVKAKRAEISALIRAAVDHASDLCLICGKPGDLDKTGGYVMLLCPHHAMERHAGMTIENMWIPD